MKHLTRIVAGLMLCASLAITPGCATGNQTAYKVVQATDTTVTTALGAWNVWVGAGKATVAQEKAVRAAFLEYQQAMLVACDAGAVWSAAASTNSTGATGAQAAWTAALSNLTKIESDFVALVKSFGVTF